MTGILQGYKTYILGGLMVLIGGLGMFGLDIAPLHMGDPGQLVTEGLAFMFLRGGVNSAVKQLMGKP